jgi:hypothetical protein
MDAVADHTEAAVTRQEIADLAIDVWRALWRICDEPQTPDRVRTAVVRVSERLEDMGIVTKDLTNTEYTSDMRARVVSQDASGPPFRIAECLAPAVYFRGRLVRPAEVVIKGVATDEQTDC